MGFFFIEGWGCFVFRSMIFRVLLKFDNCIVIMDILCVLKGYQFFNLDAPFRDIGYFFVLHITS
jgi:hypothetical protein